LGVFIVVCASFIYSLISTNTTPDTAYFNPLARVWEFLLGALVAILMPSIRLSNKLSSIFSWLGIFVLISIGFFVPRDWNFPGYVALFPVSAAILLIISGSGKERNTMVKKFLSNRYIVMLGAMSFTIYLWHWPILVFFQHYYETTNFGFVKGMIIILLGILFAIFTTFFIERPIRKIPKDRAWFSYAIGLLFFIPCIAFGVGAKYYLENLQDVNVAFKKPYFEGAEISIQNDASDLDYGYVTAISNDLGEAMNRDSGCATIITESAI
jgi:peptidoglycan/LPS O-acetylase OafA/YrhL